MMDIPPQTTTMKSRRKISPPNPATSGGEKSLTSEAIDELTGPLSPKHAKLAERLSHVYGTVGILLMPRDPYDGMLIISQSANRAEETIKAARHNKQVIAFIEKALNQTDLGTCIVGHAMMFYAIMAHHNRLPKNDLLLLSLGYTEQQVLQPPPGVSQNGHNAEQPIPVERS